MKYNLKVIQVISSNLTIEASSLEEAKFLAKEAYLKGNTKKEFLSLDAKEIEPLNIKINRKVLSSQDEAMLKNDRFEELIDGGENSPRGR